MKELLMIAVMTAGGFLFSLGGYHWKWLRRYLLPFIFGVCAFFAGCLLWKCILMTFLYIGAFCLGYGETKPYWYKFLVGLAYSMASLPLGFTGWQAVLPFAFVGLFWLSNWQPTAKMFTWKVSEFLIGSVVACQIAVLIV